MIFLTSLITRRVWFALGGSIVALAISPVAYGAALTWNSTTTYSIASPAATFQVANGSVADALTLNSTNTIVTISGTTGGSFILTSPSNDLTIASSSSGGTIAQSCRGSDNATLLTLTQTSGSNTYTITPLSNHCIGGGISSSVGGGGGGGGGGAAPIVSTATTTPITASTTPVTTATTTLAGVPVVQTTVLPLPSVTPPTPATSATTVAFTGAPANFSFKRSLSPGARSKDVRYLQQALSQVLSIPSTELVTGYFGPKTKKAVAQFQEKYGIAKKGDSGYGIVGPKTRAKLNQLMSGTTTSTTSPAPYAAGTPSISVSSSDQVQAAVQALLAKIADLQRQIQNQTSSSAAQH